MGRAIFHQYLQEIEQINMDLSAKGFIHDGNTLFFCQVGRAHQGQKLRIFLESLSKDGDFIEHLLYAFAFDCQIVQRSAVCFCNLCHEASPTPLINSEISAS